MGRGVSVFPLLPCGCCETCKQEQYARRSDYDYYGSRRDGAMAEYLAVKRENLCLLPEGVSYEEAAMSEPAAVALHAFKKSGAGQGDTLLIYGIHWHHLSDNGPVGEGGWGEEHHSGSQDG